MTRISSLILATTLAILPVAAFAQTAPAKSVTPTGITAPDADKTVADKAMTDKAIVGKPATDKTVADKAGVAKSTTMAQPAKTDAKTPAGNAKTEIHGMNGVNTHHAKVQVPAKTAEPTKS